MFNFSIFFISFGAFSPTCGLGYFIHAHTPNKSETFSLPSQDFPMAYRANSNTDERFMIWLHSAPLHELQIIILDAQVLFAVLLSAIPN